MYSLLIGIDYYRPNKLYDSLNGCVRDINLVANYLLKTLKIPPERIVKLTSANPKTIKTIETEALLPTYENIVAKFKAITEIAQPGEQVYIHYSGHGGRATTIYPELKGIDQLDEGLVPMDIGDISGRYLRDVELATLLKQMTDKRLVVTIILDSCHSGGATRSNDVKIRGGQSGRDTAPRDSESLVAPHEELVKNWLVLTEGTAINSITGRWLPQYRDYVLLAACRPNERAYEYAVNGKEMHGALTYWMIDTLTSSPSFLTYKTLHDRVSAKIQSKFLEQMPMLLGESARFVFGVECGTLQYAVKVMEVIKEEVTEKDSEFSFFSKVRLEAGMAHGLSAGTQFAIYPFGITDFKEKSKQLAIVEITAVGASDAWADVIEVLRKDEIEQGAQAVMLSAPIELVRGVSLFYKNVGEKANELPQAIKNKEKAALKAIEETLAGNGWLKLAGAKQKEDYQVGVNIQGEYEICVGTPIENLLPALKIDDPEAPKKIVQRLVHIAKYQTIQELSNQFSDLTNQLEVELLTQPKWRPGMPKKPQVFSDPTNIIVKSGEYLFLRIKNISSQVLNITVVDLEPTWAISRFQLENQERIFYPFNPNEEKLIPFSLKLPNTERYSKSRETLKVFATIQNNDFRWLELPSLDEEIAKKGEKLFRHNNQLGKLLSAIGADTDAQPELTRQAIRVFEPSQEWTTKEVQITIIK